jgi:hypothetical protein
MKTQKKLISHGKGFTTQAILFTPDSVMCFIYLYLPAKPSFQKNGEVAPGLFESFYPNKILVGLLGGHSQKQDEITRIVDDNCELIAPVNEGESIMSFDLQGLATEKNIDFDSLQLGNINLLKWLLKIPEVQPKIKALIYWPDKE